MARVGVGTLPLKSSRGYIRYLDSTWYVIGWLGGYLAYGEKIHDLYFSG